MSAPVSNPLRILLLGRFEVARGERLLRAADWTRRKRRHRQASLALATRHREARDYARALARLTPLVERDKADELVHRELMRVYALAGRRHEALRQYKVCVDALAAELDVPPEPETIALYSQILAGELAPTPAPITREIQQSALLVGREAEFSTLLSWMQAARRGQGKTILIGGEAGIGKTLLAAEALCAGAGDGLTPLFGAAYEQEGQLPYQPFVEAFDRHLAEPRRTHADEGRENPITRFKRRSGDPQQDQWAMFNTAADFLTELARHGPVALMEEAAQWLRN